MLPTAAHRSIVFTVAHTVNTVFTTAVGVVERADLLAHIQAKTLAGVLTYAEFFDARKIVFDLSIPELFIVASEMRAAMAGKKAARIALVVRSDCLPSLIRGYAEIVSMVSQHVEVFSDYDEAHAWILGSTQIPAS